VFAQWQLMPEKPSLQLQRMLPDVKVQAVSDLDS
jgi:hypothetical protein